MFYDRGTTCIFFLAEMSLTDHGGFSTEDDTPTWLIPFYFLLHTAVIIRATPAAQAEGRIALFFLQFFFPGGTPEAPYQVRCLGKKMSYYLYTKTVHLLRDRHAVSTARQRS